MDEKYMLYDLIDKAKDLDEPKSLVVGGSRSPRAEVLNWYEVIPKRFLLNSHNPHYETHRIKLPFRMLIIGSSGSAKTQSVLSLIKCMPNTWETITYITKNKDEPLLNWLEEKLGDKGLKLLEGIENLPSVDSFDKDQNNLIILDDLCLEDAKKQKPVEDFYIRCRKKNCSIIYISQSYFKCPKTCRLNLNYLIIKQISSMRDLNLVMNEYSLGVPKNTLKQMYKMATPRKIDFLMIDLEADPKDRFRKNFDETFEIDTDF
jgi:hypothetical protein